MKSIKTTILALVLAWPAASASAIGLEQYLELVRTNHPFFGKEQLAVEVERSYRETLLPEHEWAYSLEPRYSFLGQASASAYGADLAQIIALRAGLRRGFADGKSLALSVASEYSWFRNPAPAPDAGSFKHGVGLSFSWPLLKDLERLSRLGYDLQEYAVRAKEAEVQENRETFLLEPAGLFVDWAHSLEAAAIFRQRLKLAEEQLETTNRMYRSNLVDKMDVLRAEDAVRTTRQAILEYESRAMSIQAELAVLAVSQSIYQETPEFAFFSFSKLPAVEEAAAAGRRDTRLKQPLAILIEQLRYQGSTIAQKEKAELAFSVEAGIYGKDETFLESLKIIHPDAALMMSYSPAQGLKRLEAERAFIGTRVRQLEKEIEALEKNVETGVTSLLIQAVELEKIIELSRQLIASAEEKAAEEARLYSQGRNFLTNVIQSRDSVQAQKLRLVDNFARYHHLVLQYRALADQLLD